MRAAVTTAVEADGLACGPVHEAETMEAMEDASAWARALV